MRYWRMRRSFAESLTISKSIYLLMDRCHTPSLLILFVVMCESIGTWCCGHVHTYLFEESKFVRTNGIYIDLLAECFAFIIIQVISFLSHSDLKSKTALFFTTRPIPVSFYISRYRYFHWYSINQKKNTIHLSQSLSPQCISSPFSDSFRLYP